MKFVSLDFYKIKKISNESEFLDFNTEFEKLNFVQINTPEKTLLKIKKDYIKINIDQIIIKIDKLENLKCIMTEIS